MLRIAIFSLFAIALVIAPAGASENQTNLALHQSWQGNVTSTVDTVFSADGVTQCGYDGCCCEPGLFGHGIIKKSDRCFNEFISPITNPTCFEDPRNLTELRVIFLQHKIPLVPAGGGDTQLLAVGFRAALTDRLSIIGTKDGYAWSSNPLVEDGWADVAAGLKYLLYADPCKQRLLSAGLTYEMPVGSTRTLQGNGDGTFLIFLSGGTEFLDRNHWVSNAGFILPVDNGAESSWFYWSNHLDRRIADTNLYGLLEFNWYHWMEGGNGGIPGVEGGDLFNLGSVGVDGNDIVTGAFGTKWKPRDNVEVGIAWELPLTKRRDVLENRLTVDFIWRY